MTIFLGPVPDPDPGPFEITLVMLGARNVSITANGFCGNSDTLSRVVRSGQSVTVVESCECDSLYQQTTQGATYIRSMEEKSRQLLLGTLQP